jgi:hypothetical protein
MRGPFGKFVDWRQCAALMQWRLEGWTSRHYYVTLTTTTWHNNNRLPLHNGAGLPPVHELFKRFSFNERNVAHVNNQMQIEESVLLDSLLLIVFLKKQTDIIWSGSIEMISVITIRPIHT